MRKLVFVLVVAACGGGAAKHPVLPTQTPAVAPAADLAEAKGSALRDPDGRLVAKDPRIVDLDIIRVTAQGGDQVATGDLFREASEAVKAGETEKAIGIYRRLVNEFPESTYAPTALFNIAAIYDGRRDLPATTAALRELVKAYPDSRESVDGHLYIAALYTDHEQYGDALTTLDEALARTNLTYADRVEAFARKGYVLVELRRYDDAEVALDSAVAESRKVTHLEDTYYIAMATYYRGELAHRRFTEAPVRLPDDQLVVRQPHGRLGEPAVGELPPVVGRHRDVIGVLEVGDLARLGDRAVEGDLGVVVAAQLDEDVALARECLDPIGVGQVRAGERLVEGRQRIAVLLVIGVERGDVEVPVDRLAAVGVRLDELAQRGRRRRQVAPPVIDRCDVEQRGRRVRRLRELVDEPAIDPDRLLRLPCLHRLGRLAEQIPGRDLVAALGGDADDVEVDDPRVLGNEPAVGISQRASLGLGEVRRRCDRRRLRRQHGVLRRTAATRGNDQDEDQLAHTQL
jgi:tetratricopeptide (TPR) repeat protein